MMKAIVALLQIVSMVALSDEGKLLVLHPMYAASHILTLRSLSKALVEKGHQVTILRWKDVHDLPPCTDPGITEYLLTMNNSDGSIYAMSHEEHSKFLPPKELMWNKGTSLTALPIGMFLTVAAFCRNLFEQKDLIQVLKQEQFDAAVVDLIYNECSLGLAYDLGIPAIGFWAFTFVGGEPQYTTAFNSPASTPVLLSHYTDVMSFSQRMFNFVLEFFSHAVMRVQFLITGYYISKYIPNTPSPEVLLANLSGALINTHPVIEYPRLLPPSFLEVGGLQIRDVKPLPKDLEQVFIESGDAGIILFTMGFTFETSIVPRSVVSNLLGAFSQLKQRIIMRMEGPLENITIPANVKVVNWLPQQDVLGIVTINSLPILAADVLQPIYFLKHLAHPKTVLFFTHCGMHGVMEAIHYAVPMVGMPIFADQMDVLVRIEHKGIGLGVQKYASQDQFYQTITQVINNQSYHDNIRRLSKILRDDREHPMDRAVWLVEHVMKTGGAEHLKMSSRHLSLLQYFGVDVLFVLCLIWLFFLFVFLLFCKYVFICKTKWMPTKEEKNKND